MTRTLLPYQTAWVRDPTPLAVIEKSRRIGISWAEAYHAVMHAGDGRGDIYYQSYDKDMTRGFIEDCADWVEHLNISAEAMGESFLDNEARDIQVFRINMGSGKKILAMTSSPRGFRSKGRPGDVAVIDEAAFVDDIDEVLKAALAFNTWGGRVRVISTHNGEANPFNALLRDIREGRQPGTLHRVTLREAVGQGLYSRIAAITGQSDTTDAAHAWEAAIRAQIEALRQPSQRSARSMKSVPSKLTSDSSKSKGWGSSLGLHAAEQWADLSVARVPSMDGADVVHHHFVKKIPTLC